MVVYNPEHDVGALGALLHDERVADCLKVAALQVGIERSRAHDAEVMLRRGARAGADNTGLNGYPVSCCWVCIEGEPLSSRAKPIQKLGQAGGQAAFGAAALVGGAERFDAVC